MYPLRLKALTELAGLAGLGALQCRNPGLQAEARQSETRNKAKMFHSEGDQALERAPREAFIHWCLQIQLGCLGVSQTQVSRLGTGATGCGSLACRRPAWTIRWPLLPSNSRNR